MSAATAAVAARANPARARAAALNENFMIASFCWERSAPGFAPNLVRELQPKTEDVEILALFVGKHVNRSGELVDVHKHVVELELHVLVQIPVQADQEDALVAAIDARLGRGRRDMC